MCRNKLKTRMCAPAKIQITMRIRVVWSEFSSSTFWIAVEANFLREDKLDSAQTVRLIWKLKSKFGFVCFLVLFVSRKIAVYKKRNVRKRASSLEVRFLILLFL